MLLSVVLIAGCDGKKKHSPMVKPAGPVDVRQLEKGLKDYDTETISRGVKLLTIEDVARLTNEIALKTGKKPMLAGGGDGYICNFDGHSLAVFLAEYSRLSGKTVIQETDEPAEGVTFRLEYAMPEEEAARAMESFLSEKFNVVFVADEAGDLRAVKEKVDGR